MSSIASILAFCVITGWQGLPATNYVFTTPPPSNRIMGVVMPNPPLNYKVIRAEDFAFMCEMAAEREYIADPYSDADYRYVRDWGGTVVSNSCGLYIDRHSMPNLLETISGISKIVLSNHPYYCWYPRDDSGTIGYLKKVGDWNEYQSMPFTNFMYFCTGLYPTNLAGGAVKRVTERGKGYAGGLPADDVAAVMAQLQGVGGMWLAVDDAHPGNWNLPTNSHNSTKVFVDSTQETIIDEGDHFSITTTTTNGVSEGGSWGYWNDGNGYALTQSRSKAIQRGWYFDTDIDDWQHYDSQVAESSSVRTEGQTAPLIITAWKSDCITNSIGEMRIGGVYGFMMVHFKRRYADEHRKGYYIGDEPSDYINTEWTRNVTTNEWAVAVPLTFNFHSYGDDGMCKWASQGIASIEDLFNALAEQGNAGGDGDGASFYGGSSTSGGNLPTLQTPTAWTREHYRTIEEYSQYYQITLSSLELYLLIEPTPRVEYKAGTGGTR